MNHYELRTASRQELIEYLEDWGYHEDGLLPYRADTEHLRMLALEQEAIEAENEERTK